MMASAGETADPGLIGLNMDNDKVRQKGFVSPFCFKNIVLNIFSKPYFD